MGLVGGLCGVALHVRVDRRLVLGCFGVLGALWMDGGGLVAGMRCSFDVGFFLALLNCLGHMGERGVFTRLQAAVRCSNRAARSPKFFSRCVRSSSSQTATNTVERRVFRSSFSYSS